ncbi:MAG: hypothetical protein JKY48_07790 [Flavobacteriales bacterium]|nr:hypothetical protein [Flavobacteriales bacterium]
MKYLTKIGIGFSLALSLAACRDDDEFSEVPELFFRDFQKTTSTTAVWSLGFTDGDGDIGVRNDDDRDNFIVTIHRIDNGVESIIPDSIVDSDYRIPVVKNIPTSNGIEGEFKFTLETLSYKLFPEPVDSMYISGFVRDRANNESNVVRTPVFTAN